MNRWPKSSSFKNIFDSFLLIVGKSKIWSAQMPQLFNQMYAYDGFCLNLCYLMLKLSVPFSEPQCDKLLKVQPTYCSVNINNDNDKSQQKNIHAFGK